MIDNLFDRRYAKNDIIAGLTLSVESIPDGMAIGSLAAINPISGVYAYMVGCFSGAFFTSSVSMSVQATSAMAVIIAALPETRLGQPTAQSALLLLAVLTGIFMWLFGQLGLGSALRFFPNTVMSSFTHAIGFIIILGQLGDLTGYNAQGLNKPMQTIDLLLHLDQVKITSLLTGLMAIVLTIVLTRTRLKSLGILIAIFLSSLLPLVLGWDSVAKVQDIAPIPQQLPHPIMPELSTLPNLVMPALALAIIGLVQGAVISHQFPNPDGSKPDASGDFKGQGIANIFSGFFQGMPVGASFSATSILAEAGARTRLANIAAGLGIAGLLLLFHGIMGLLAMPALAGFLIVLGVGVLKPRELLETWRLGGLHRIGMVSLILVALFVSLQYAVFLGVVVAGFLYIIQQSNDVTVRESIYEQDHLIFERDIEPDLAPNSIVSLQYYGSLFYASAELYEEQLPHPTSKTKNAVVILNLHGQTDLDSTVLDMLVDYALKLQKHDSRLILAGVEDSAREKMGRLGKLDAIGSENVFSASEFFQESMLKARHDAEEWINR
jgi:SulP family sulfate permease